MPTTDELQAQINALQQQLNQIIGMSNDDYVLTYSGDEVDDLLAKASSAVRYDLAQSLTAAQQKQARENIGADAVQGVVRYDQAQSLSSAQRALALSNIDAISRTAELCTDCNTTVKAGIYRISGSTKNGPSYITAGLGHLLIVLPWDQNTLVQIYYAPERALKFCRFSSSGWKPWECVNPLLNLGGEYRTTERYLGKPVYVKLVNFGALPNAGSKDVAHGLTGLSSIWIDLSRSVITASSGFPLAGNTNLIPTHPSITRIIPRTNSDGNSVITVDTSSNLSAYSAAFCLRYTKTTD